MRQVFSSPRIENVDRVEEMMHEAGIQTYVSNRDKLRRDRLRSFSYSAKSNRAAWPAVWITLAEDLPKAREMLRDAGLMGSTRPNVATEYELRPRDESSAPRRASHVRRVLLVLAVISALYLFAFKALQAPSMQTPRAPMLPKPAPTEPVNTLPEEPTIFILDESNRAQ